MRWVRSFPSVVPPGRSYVVDMLPRLTMTNYDYTPLASLDDDICLLEWDIALSETDRKIFELQTHAEPGRVRVAPYLLSVPGPLHYAHRRLVSPILAYGKLSERWINQADAFCEYFGFGCIYLPRDLIRRFSRANARERGGNPPADTRFTDQTFSYWHYHGGHGPVPIEWAITAVHLH